MTLRHAALALALAGVAATAHAGVRASAVRSGNWDAYSPAEVFVPLNGAGATTLTFKLASAGRKLLTYSAECAVRAPVGAYTAWLDVDIYVNGVIVTPTDAVEDPFCSSRATGFGHFARASVTIAIQGKSGDNTIRIKAKGNNNATGLWLGDSALVVYD